MPNFNLGEAENANLPSPDVVQPIAELAHTVPHESKNLSLMQIISTELAIYKQIEEAGGEITPELDFLLDLVQLDKADKLDACKYLLDQFKLRAEFLKEKEEEFRRSRKTCEDLQERIKRRIKDGMTALGIDEALGNDFRFKLSISKEPKIVVDESKIPGTFMKVIETFVPNREKISDALKAGFEIPGACFEPVVTLRSYVNTKTLKNTPKKKELK